MDGWMDGRMDRWIDGRTDGWMDGLIDGWIYIYMFRTLLTTKAILRLVIFQIVIYHDTDH